MKFVGSILLSTIFSIAFVTGCGDLLQLGESSEDKSKHSKEGKHADHHSLVSLKVNGIIPSDVLALTLPSIDVLDKDGQLSGSIELSEARLVLDQIRLKPVEKDDEAHDDENQDDESHGAKLHDDENHDDHKENHGHKEHGEPRFHGPYVVNLLQNTISPEPKEIHLPSGLYRRVELRVHKLEDMEADLLDLSQDDPLRGNSIFVKGQYTPAGGEAKSFSMSFDLSEKFEIRDDKGFEITPGDINNFLISFKLNHWFKFNDPETNDGHSLNDISDAEIKLDEDSKGVSKDIRKTIKENIKNSADMSKDDQDDQDETKDGEKDEGEGEKDEGEGEGESEEGAK